ncbi:DNA polymerase III subunit delta' [Dechloromonas sp. TW-R-39-2]|uniref:DNA polymerase III subunit delta' n=1 Tax=Dechloromonas sp. TW-R-39-2 TaxID=2654218 RepID=UPI00193D123C|nr:DNA polymerase III subunit delta' [Dechloromonas sp. TW-R-39-2]QRM19820.1 DNA polymerase III subunit delta' [Dechloromonas sp. TW-R-39-2]
MNILKLHEQVWSDLQGRRQKLPHALLLVGQKGIGKFELAKLFAASLLCEQPQHTGIPCGACLACNWYSQGNHPDFRLLQPEALSADLEAEEGKKKPSQQITIDQVRGLDDFLIVGTHRAGLRIVVVNPTEAMNRNTANALLKTLEEPAPNTLFLLVSSEPLRLLPTIRSRCQTMPVALPSSKVAAQVLADDGIPDAARWLALAGGSPSLAIELATSGQGAWLELLVKRLSAGRHADPLAMAAELEKAVKDSKGKLLLKTVVEALQKWLIDLNLAKNGMPTRYFLPQQATMTGLADMIPAVRLLHCYRHMISRRQEAEQPLNARLFLEGIFLDYRALFAN